MSAKKRLHTAPLVAASLALVGSLALGNGAAAQPTRAESKATRPLACAVETLKDKPLASQVCKELARALERPTKLVENARGEKHSQAVQILRDDVQWTVILLEDGNVRAWTRISTADAEGKEANYFARALRVLLRTSPKRTESCVRVGPNEGRSERAPDLVYPWAELKPCVHRSIDIVDPWWK